MFLYDVSIIVPIYNAEQFLHETIQSVLTQEVGELSYELLLVDDGSTDKSSEICLSYTKNQIEDNIKYFRQNNLGVSAARNTGITQATGKYILFLDSDDLLSPQTILHVINCFNEFDDLVDIIAYPLYNLDSGKLTSHPRSVNYQKKGVFDVNVSKFMNQCTMNVVVKNLKNDRIYFDTTLKQSEDALFNTFYVMRKEKIGICNAGGYIYRRDNSSAVDKFKSPVHIGNQLLEFFEKMLENFKTPSKKIPDYVQSMILYEINWRFKENTLFPYHLTENDFKLWKGRFDKVLDEISNFVIMKQPFIDYYHRFYFIQSKSNRVFKILTDTRGVYIYDSNELLVTIDNFTLVFTKMDIRSGVLRMAGYVKAPFLDLINPDLVLIFDSQEYSVNLSDTNADYYKSKIKTNKFLFFEENIPLESLLNGNLRFAIKVQNFEYSTSYYMMDRAIIKKYLPIKNVIVENFNIRHSNNPVELRISKATKIDKKEINKLYRKQLKKRKLKFQLLYRQFESFLSIKDPVWIYNDRPGVFDNGYYQFKHDFNINDGVRRYYITYEGEDIRNRFTPDEEKNILVFGSKKHKYYFVNASMILTSFQDSNEYSPFDSRNLNNISDLLKYQLIYLQHGILHAHTPWIYSSEKTGIDKFVVSSDYEKQNLIENYKYKSDQIIVTGMPRFDVENISLATKKKILFAPSWRRSLTRGIVNKKWILDFDLFKNSTYYKGIDKLLSSEELKVFLQENELQLDLNLHPIFADFASVFNLSDNISLVNSDVKKEEYSIFITDFSSYLFDFVYRNTPIIYFIPDYNEFLSGNHLYNKLDLEFEEGFGPLCLDYKDLVIELDKLCKRDFKADNEYDERSLGFFSHKENHREKLYRELIKL
ncbi:glycosyltransferase [Paenibacillus sp. MABNR03]|uniref:glycosyltransferase n=1 Tax=Paenibacillus sp. MABNR03 TaxID=3142626 RepID=UPI003D2CDC8B